MHLLIRIIIMLCHLNMVYSMDNRAIQMLLSTPAEHVSDNFFEESIKPVCKNFFEEDIKPVFKQILNKCTSLKEIGKESCENKSAQEKDILLQKIVQTMDQKKDTLFLPVIAAILIYAGANPNMVFTGEALLHKAILMNNIFLINALFESNKLDYNYKHYLIGPIFFDAPTIEIAQRFIHRGIDISQVNDNDHTVLWHLRDALFPPNLMRFYLKNKVKVMHICHWDGSCVLHHFASHYDIKNDTDKQNFLIKVGLLLNKAPNLITIKNNYCETPPVVAAKTIQTWGKKYPQCVLPLQQLIELCKRCQTKVHLQKK
jgi:hypothetical protein